MTSWPFVVAQWWFQTRGPCTRLWAVGWSRVLVLLATGAITDPQTSYDVTLRYSIEHIHMTACWRCPPTWLQAASIATEINIHIYASIFFILLCLTVSPWTSPFVHGFSAWLSHTCVVRMTALDIPVSLRNPTAMLEYCMTSYKDFLYIRACYI